LPWILIGCGSIGLLAVLVVVVAVGIMYYRFAGSPTTGPRRPRPGILSRGDVKLVEDHGIQTVAKTWSSCTALAPADWTIIGNEERVGMGVDLTSPDKSMGASYGIAGGAYYGMSTPEDYIQKLMQTAGLTGFEFENR